MTPWQAPDIGWRAYRFSFQGPCELGSRWPPTRSPRRPSRILSARFRVGRPVRDGHHQAAHGPNPDIEPSSTMSNSGHFRTFRHAEAYRGDHPNRFHAACRETASASPMIAQLTSRSRRMSAISCIAAPILSKAPSYPAKVFNNASVGALSGNSDGTSCVLGWFFFSMMGRQRCTHSSQIKTPGPATSVFTSVCAFPQKEQRYSRLKTRGFDSDMGPSLSSTAR
jgi:hypothetical protein